MKTKVRIVGDKDDLDLQDDLIGQEGYIDQYIGITERPSGDYISIQTEVKACVIIKKKIHVIPIYHLEVI